MCFDDASDVVVEELTQCVGVMGLSPIGEHHRHRAQDLHMDALSITFLNARLRVPAVASHLSEEAVIHHHPSTTRFMMIQMDESPVSESGLEIRDILRKDVRVDIYGQDVLHVSALSGLYESGVGLHDMATVPTSTQSFRRIEFLESRKEILLYVGQWEVGLMELVIAFITEP